MHLFGDVCLIENEKLAPPTVGTSALELTMQASKFEVRKYRDHYCYSSGKYNWKPSPLELCGEVAVLLSETHFNGQGQESNPWIMLWR